MGTQKKRCASPAHHIDLRFGPNGSRSDSAKVDVTVDLNCGFRPTPSATDLPTQQHYITLKRSRTNFRSTTGARKVEWFCVVSATSDQTRNSYSKETSVNEMEHYSLYARGRFGT